MKRRSFLKKGVVFGAGVFLAPGILGNCRKNEFTKDIKFKGSVVVVGAGASGLYCAQLLQKAGCKVTVLEARKTIGGRIRKLEGFTDFPVELGAEEIHGEKSLYYRMVQSYGAKLVDGDSEDYIYIDNKLQVLSSIKNDGDVSRADSLITSLEENKYSGGDVTLETFLNGRYNLRVWPYLNARIANEHGTSQDRISLQGVANENELWTAGSENFLLKGGAHIDVLKNACADVLDKVILNSPVRSIDYTGAQVIVTTLSGKTYSADKVVITVPVSILKQKSIRFSPALPANKLAAIDKIGMGAGMKVILKFNRRFWPEDMGSLFGGGQVPEFWATGAGRSEQNNCITAFVHGRNAERLQAMGNSLMLDQILRELDDAFGINTASGAISDFYIMNWANEPYIQGTYSYPVVGEGTARNDLAADIDKKVFFAGEASHTRGHFASIHGAIETGVRAASEILELDKK